MAWKERHRSRDEFFAGSNSNGGEPNTWASATALRALPVVRVEAEVPADTAIGSLHNHHPDSSQPAEVLRVEPGVVELQTRAFRFY